MSLRHPIISVTGSSGAGTSTVKTAFEHIFLRGKVRPLIVEGDSFHRYDRVAMKAQTDEATRDGRHFSHFGPEANLFDELEACFRQYAETGSTRRRLYLHNAEEAAPFGQDPGTFTPWEEHETDSDVLFYEGLHGAVATPEHNIAQHADLLVGVVPIVNLEWIQKIHRDT